MGYFYDDRTFKGAARHAGIAQDYQCGACGTPTPMQYDYVDKHGDIEALCANCYTLALEGSESPELASRDRRAAWILATIGAVLLLVWITGCSNRHTVEYRVVNGKRIAIHTDAPESLEKTAKNCLEPWDGCADIDTNRVFMRSPVVENDVEHELDHHAGMRHWPWMRYGYFGTCAYVFAGGKKYRADTMICRVGKQETIYNGLEFFKMAGVI